MINKNSLKDIIQIYEFIKERPNYLGKSQFEKIKELLVELNESSNIPIRVVSQTIFSGSFGKKNNIDIRDAPLFEKKAEFVAWMYQELSS